MTTLPLLARRGSIIFAAAVLFAGASLDAQAVGSHINPGSNSRGYLDERIGGIQTFTAGCATAGFLPGFDPTTMSKFDAGNITISEATGCTHAGWTGTSIMSSGPQTISSYTTVTVNDPSTVFNNGADGVLSLSRSAYVDAAFLSSASVIPDSVSFSFNLNGTASSTLGPNSISTNFANFSVGWDTDTVPNITFVLQPSGSYYFAFAITPDMLDRWVPFATTLETFANMFAIDPTQEFSGSATTDYSHTLTLTKVAFLADDGSGPGEDISNLVNAQFQSGTNYTANTPEPSSILLSTTGVALVGLVGARRRKRHSI